VHREKNKKKSILLLAGVLLGGAVVMVCLGQSDRSEATKPLFDNSGQLFANDPNFLSKRADGAGNSELFFKMMLSVSLVIAMGVAAIYILKKFLPRIANMPGKEIRIIETAHLGPRKTVHLLKIGNQRLLIGSTNDRITMLADVTDSSMDFSVENIDMTESINGR